MDFTHEKQSLKQSLSFDKSCFIDFSLIAAESTLVDYPFAGMEDEICPYATFHLLGFREEMDPSKAMQFQTFPHPGNGHSGTMGPPVGHPTNASAHSRSGSQSMVFYIFYIYLIKQYKQIFDHFIFQE